MSKTNSMSKDESLDKKILYKEKALNKIEDNITNEKKMNSKKTASKDENKVVFESSFVLTDENDNDIKKVKSKKSSKTDTLDTKNKNSSTAVEAEYLDEADNNENKVELLLDEEDNFEDADFEILPSSATIIDGVKQVNENTYNTLLLDEDDDDDDESTDFSDLSDIEDSLYTDLEEPSLSENLPQVSNPRLPNVFVKDNLQLYLREISAFPLLTPEEELEFAHKVRESNDPDAAFRLISSHLRLVVKVAMEFQKRWMQNVLDLVQEGNIGLVRAVNKFDPDKGIKFSYYAKFWIRAYILKFIMDNWRMVKIGTTQAQRKLFYNLNKEKQKLISQGFDPDMDVLVERLGVSKEDILEMEQRLESTDLSLDTPVGDESGSISRIEYLPALTQGIEEGFAESEITDIIHAKLESFIPMLSDKEVFILENRLLTDDPITLREIGEKYNVTRERIRQLEARLVEKMRNYLTAEIDDFSEEWISL